MKTYRKKPTIVEAVQLTEKNIVQVFNIIHPEKKAKNFRWDKLKEHIIMEGITVKTPEGNLKLKIGNYLIRGYSQSLGVHYWPVEKEYFEENYELIDESTISKK